jgi:hypothetical protein
MLAMQYEVTLPADYDMGIIDERIATRGPLLDDLPGLGLKAYAVRRRGLGSEVNQYAPFYLWSSPEAMSRFLSGGGFRSLCESFGRPTVKHWVGVRYVRGRSEGSVPRSATRETIHLSSVDALARAVADAEADARRALDLPDLHSQALALDPHGWQLVRFSIWSGTAPETDGVSYEVRHLSAPMPERL